MVGVLQAQTVPSDPITNGTKGIYGYLKSNVARAAEKMPEANYAFKPTPEVRNFGQLVAHIADAQYIFCSMATGKPGNGPGIENKKTTKAEIIEALKEAYGYCDEVYAGMTDAKTAELVKFLGRDMPRISVLAFNNAHMDEHYGNIVTYMRLKGLVPPTSEAQPPAR
jgi:uncharacterized damage-inducible protein DinB